MQDQPPVRVDPLVDALQLYKAKLWRRLPSRLEHDARRRLQATGSHRLCLLGLDRIHPTYFTYVKDIKDMQADTVKSNSTILFLSH
jgi:hypothetical protein